MTKKLVFEGQIHIRNKKASFEYALLDQYTAGLVLQGTEIKSIRQGKVDLTDGYCFFDSGELFVKDIVIGKYEKGTHYNHEERKPRKLLLNKSELRKIASKLHDAGLTLIPVHLFINPKGIAKLDIAIGKGKKLHDKRESMKERDTEREINRFVR
jgi:SsrA-binding protein